MTQLAYFCGHEQFQPETLVRHADGRVANVAW